MTSRPFLLRLIIPFTLMMVVVVAVSGWVVYKSGYDLAHQQQALDLGQDAELMASIIRDAGGELTPAARARLIQDASVRQLRYTLIAPDGGILLDTDSDPLSMDNHNDRPEIVAARRDGSGSSIRQSRSMGTAFVYAARRVTSPDGMIARASRMERNPRVISTKMLVQLGVAVVASVLVMTGLAAALYRRWIAPIRRMAQATEQMAAGRWQTRVEPAGEDELRQFSTRLNGLAEQAERQVHDLEHQREDLTSLVDSLPDPIIVTDPRQHVLLINQPAARFLQITPKQATGAKLISLLGEPTLLELYEHVLSYRIPHGQPHQREIRVVRQSARLIYQAVAARMPAGGVLLVLRDVTQLASAVQMKTDFVANASHELRTPIAAIKLAFETLSEVYEEEPQQTARCITIIEGHLRRLEELLADLLDLSRVETAEIKPQLGTHTAAELLGTMQTTQGPLARNKNLDLIVEAPEHLEIHTDRRLLDLVLKNLVENSIKYTPAGGKVTVRLWHDPATDYGPAICLSVTDTGIGIPPQHLERVFERFYQVDAARSGAIGRGTGLGLAIVKHAVHALGGQVKLDSVVGRGTTITCVLPEQVLSPV